MRQLSTPTHYPALMLRIDAAVMGFAPQYVNAHLRKIPYQDRVDIIQEIVSRMLKYAPEARSDNLAYSIGKGLVCDYHRRRQGLQFDMGELDSGEILGVDTDDPETWDTVCEGKMAGLSHTWLSRQYSPVTDSSGHSETVRDHKSGRLFSISSVPKSTRRYKDRRKVYQKKTTDRELMSLWNAFDCLVLRWNIVRERLWKEKSAEGGLDAEFAQCWVDEVLKELPNRIRTLINRLQIGDHLSKAERVAVSKFAHSPKGKRLAAKHL